MKILKIYGETWPLIVFCPLDRANIEVSLPTDLRRIRKFHNTIVEGVTIPELVESSIVCICPLCGEQYEVAESRIPTNVLDKIPNEDVNI